MPTEILSPSFPRESRETVRACLDEARREIERVLQDTDDVQVKRLCACVENVLVLLRDYKGVCGILHLAGPFTFDCPWGCGIEHDLEKLGYWRKGQDNPFIKRRCKCGGRFSCGPGPGMGGPDLPIVFREGAPPLWHADDDDGQS